MHGKCEECGFQLRQATKFCQQCGKKLAIDAAPTFANAMPPPVPTSHDGRARETKKAKKKKKKHRPVSDVDSNCHADRAPHAAGSTSDRTRDVLASASKADASSVPSAATGIEASSIYKRMIAAIRGANRGDESVVVAFRSDCKRYGQGELRAKEFLDHLDTYFGSCVMIDHMLPQLVRLIPDEKKRAKLIKTHAKRPSQSTRESSALKSSRSSSSRSLYQSQRRSGGSEILSASTRSRPPSAPEIGGKRPSSSISSKLMLNRYADNPKCVICNELFDLTRRRHLCRKCGASVCSSCSPARMLVSPDQVVDGVKDYDPAHSQRVCTLCAPMLQYFQENLNPQFANCHKENPHESKPRLHLPYSNSLEKECRNAADILGNFFRPDCGAESDRHIPIAFLKRAHGLAFLTVLKAGLLISARVGTGIVISKLPNGSWPPPSAIGTAGLSGGLEAGGEIVEFMIILGSPSAVKVFHRTQVNVGGGLSVAVGPYGRAAESHAAASRGAINANFSYSHSRGLYAGISLHGAVISCRSEMNSNFYGKQLTPEEILSGQVPPPRVAEPLYQALQRAMEGVAAYENLQMLALEEKQRCRECACDRFLPKAFSKKCKLCGHAHV